MFRCIYYRTLEWEHDTNEQQDLAPSGIHFDFNGHWSHERPHEQY